MGTAKGSASCQLLCLHMPWLALASPARSLRMQWGWSEGVDCSHGPGTHSRFCPRDSGQNSGKKGKRKAFAFQKEKEGEHDSEDKAAFKPSSRHCLLLVLKMGMRNLAHPWLTDGLWLGFFAGVSGACGKMSWNSGQSPPPSVLGYVQGREGMQMVKSHARLRPLELCNPSLCLLGHLVWLPSATVACPTRLISCQVCGPPLPAWPQICRAQREGRNCGEQQLENVFPSARALLTLSIHSHTAGDSGEAGWEQS